MKTYLALQPVDIATGTLGALTADQIRRRRHLLKDQADGLHRILKPVQFKAGETFAYDGDIPATVARQVNGNDVTVAESMDDADPIVDDDDDDADGEWPPVESDAGPRKRVRPRKSK